MRIFKSYSIVCICFAAFASFATPSQAALIEFDFTDHAMFSDVNRKTSVGPITIAGFEISFTAAGRMTTNARDRRGCLRGQFSAHNLVCDGDGIGIGDDEITANGERLTVILNWNGAYRIAAIEFLDLFAPEGRESEYAQYQINGGPTNDVASQSRTGGYVYEPVGLIMNGLTTMDFFTNRNRRSDFALARIVVETANRQDVSEPPFLATFAIFLMILTLLGLRRSPR